MALSLLSMDPCLLALPQRHQHEEDWVVEAGLPFSILDDALTDVHLDVRGGLGWGTAPRFTLSVDADTGVSRKVSLAHG